MTTIDRVKVVFDLVDKVSEKLRDIEERLAETRAKFSNDLELDVDSLDASANIEKVRTELETLPEEKEVDVDVDDELDFPSLSSGRDIDDVVAELKKGGTFRAGVGADPTGDLETEGAVRDLPSPGDIDRQPLVQPDAPFDLTDSNFELKGETPLTNEALEKGAIANPEINTRSLSEKALEKGAIANVDLDTESLTKKALGEGVIADLDSDIDRPQTPQTDMQLPDPGLGGVDLGGGDDNTNISPRDFEFEKDSPFNFLEVAKKSRNLEEFAKNMDVVDLRMRRFWNTLADIVPVLVVFIGALPSAISGLVALAGGAIAVVGALTAIAGLGLFGMMREKGESFSETLKDIKKKFKELGSSFLDAIAPLAQKFAPVMKGLLDGAKSFFGEIASALRPLLRLRGAFREITGIIGDMVVEGVSGIVQLAQAFDQVIINILLWAKNLNVVEILVNLFAKTRAGLSKLFDLVTRLIPVVIDLSTGFLFVATGILKLTLFLGGLIKTLISLFGIIPNVDKGVSILIGGLLFGMTVVVLLAKAIKALSIVMTESMVVGIMNYISGMAQFIASTITGISTIQALITHLITAVVAVGLLTAGLSILAGSLGTLFVGQNLPGGGGEFGAGSRGGFTQVNNNFKFTGSADRNSRNTRRALDNAIHDMESVQGGGGR